ncbi:hypothetical protein ACDQ55_18960 [Chitinophaga sp. 30R24]|uniref:hypothetical protein n=1 Tax=Chitinophaga sp. 30R24 TaxID=3248838 RepID=UPI003B8FB6F8
MKDAVVNYIRDQVIGRQLDTAQLTYSLEGGKLQGIYSDRMFFADLATTEAGLQFNMITITSEKVYTLDHHRQRIGLQKDFTGTSVFRYELAMRKSSGQLTGYMRCLSSTVNEYTMEAIVYGIYGVKLEDGMLKWKEQQLLYRDTLTGDNNYRAVAFDANIRFYQESGKLRFEYVPFYSDVDINTLHKTGSADQYPPFISKEQ